MKDPRLQAYLDILIGSTQQRRDAVEYLHNLSEHQDGRISDLEFRCFAKNGPMLCDSCSDKTFCSAILARNKLTAKENTLYE